MNIVRYSVSEFRVLEGSLRGGSGAVECMNPIFGDGKNRNKYGLAKYGFLSLY